MKDKVQQLIHTIFFLSIKIFYFLRALLTTNRIYLFLEDVFFYSYLKYFGVETEFRYVRLIGLPIIAKKPGSRIILGKGITLVSNSRGNVAGINHPVILATLSPDAVIHLEEGCGLSGSSLCAFKSIKIGLNSGLGANTSVYDTDFHSTDYKIRKNQVSIADADSKPVAISSDVWVAANTLILKGVRIGSKAIIGAGSVVTTDIPPNSLAAGNPAKVIRIIESEKIDGSESPFR